MSVAAKSAGSDRALLVVEALVGLGVVTAIIGRSYGVFPTLAFVSCGVAVAYTGWVASRMLGALRDPTLEVGGRRRDFEREKLEGEKRLLLQGIKDLEADKQTGKMDDAEYERLRQSAEARAVEILRILRESDERWSAAAEALVEKRLGRLPGSAPSEPAAAAPVPLTPRPEVVDRPAADPRVFSSEVSTGTLRDGRLECQACGFDNDEDARFCAGCGRTLGRNEAA